MSKVVPIKPEPRATPANVEQEQALLGAIFINNDAWHRVSDFLAPEHFSEALHAKIYELICSLMRMGKVATPVTLRTFLPADLNISGLSGPQYLARLAAEATTIINAEDYGRGIYDLAMRRALIGIGQDVVNSAFDAPPDVRPHEIIEDTEGQLYRLAEAGRAGQGGFQAFAKALSVSIDMTAKAYQRDGKLAGLSTGLKDLDALIGGMQPSDLVVLAARPGMGKTALATNIAYSVARAHQGHVTADGRHVADTGGVVGFFSLEMSGEQLATRILAEQTGITSNRMRRGQIEPSDFDRIVDVARAIETLPLHVDESGGISIAQLVGRARRLKRQRGLDLIVVDYIQLLSGSREKRQFGRVQEVTEITTGLKALAKELNVPVLALSQLSRNVENRDDKRPQLSDLRESGSIEQDADVVMFLYREEYYLKSREPKVGSEEHFKWEVLMDAALGRAEAIIGKQRHGPTGTCQLKFEAKVTRFSDKDEPALPARLAPTLFEAGEDNG